MLAIELKGVSYTYSRKTPYEKRALDGVNLAVEKGEFVGLIGATGSGKSTLIQHLNGLIRPQEGEVLVLGMNASDKKTLKKLRFFARYAHTAYPERHLSLSDADDTCDMYAFSYILVYDSFLTR